MKNYTSRAEAQQDVNAILLEAGLDPTRISADNWDEEGFELFAFDEDGHLRRDSLTEEPIHEWARWPEGFPYERFAHAATYVAFGRRLARPQFTEEQVERAARVFYESQTGMDALETSLHRDRWLDMTRRALEATA